MRGTFIFTSLVIGSFFVIAAMFMSAVNGTQSPPPEETIDLNKTAQALAATYYDSDNDGLSDWEERLWGTDPLLPDTDYDGTTDGEEVAQKRNPLIAGPNDALTSLAATSSAVSQNNTAHPFTEGSFAESFAQTYIAMGQGTGWSEKQKIDLAEKLLAEIQGNDILKTEKVISLQQLTRTDLNTPHSYNAYALGLKARLAENRPAEPENEATLLQRAIETNHSANFEKLGAIALSHEKTADALSALPTPAGLAIAHLELVNSLYNISIAVYGMQRAQNDPIAGLAGIQRYAPAQQRLAAALLSINNELKKHGVSL